jgi:glycosyltransferase involved in cell wall biosynthesis
VLSDAIAERNGAGAYYHDLEQQLAPRLEAMRTLQPRREPRFRRLAIPLPGDATQKLKIPNLWRIQREVRALQPNLVLSVTPGPFGLLGPFIARRLGCALLTGFHTDFEALARLYWHPGVGRVIKGYLRSSSRHLIRRADTVFINNSDLTPVVEALGAMRCEVVGTPLASTFVLGEPANTPITGQRILFAGRLAAEKNIEAVIEAARWHPHRQFSIGGDGPQRAMVVQAAAGLPNLQYLGWLTRDTLREQIDQHDLLVLPSHVETFGSIALEAMSRRRPALVSANAGIHDWPELSRGLYRIEPEESLSEALERLSEVPEAEYQTSAEAAREQALALNEQTLAQWQRVLFEHLRAPA